MAKYGYARVSSADQDCAIQVEALQKAGCEIIRQEKVSGRDVDNRPELRTLLEFLRSGDELVVTKIDRLARSVRDLANIVHDLKGRGVALRVEGIEGLLQSFLGGLARIDRAVNTLFSLPYLFPNKSS